MSAFLDEVFAVQQAQQHPPRRTGEGLSGSSKRFAILLTLMVGLTAVPTYIMVRVGVEELRSSAASPVRPILLDVPDKAPPQNQQPLPIEPEQSWALPVIPPKPIVPQSNPILERKAVVDTSPRPVAKKQKVAPAPAPIRPSTSEIPAPPPPVLEPVRKPKKHKAHHVDRPEKPEVERPYRERTARPRS